MGTAGAAFATILAQLISGALCVWYTFRMLPFLKVRGREWKPEAVSLGTEYMRIFTAFFLAGGILVVYHNILRASGDVSVTVLMGVSEVVTRIGCSFLLPRVFGYQGLWFVSPLTWTCAALVGGARYYSGVWEKKAKMSGKRGKTDGEKEKIQD